MSSLLSIRAWLRAGLALAGTALLVTGCSGAATPPTRPVAAVTTAIPAAPAAPRSAALPPGDQVQLARRPSPRWSPGMTYDGARGDVLLFGGQTGSTFLGDTWSWDGHRWSLLHPLHAPSPRASAEMAYDPRHQQVVLFGGFAAGPDLADTWLWDGRDWTRTTPAFNPAPTHEQGITYFAGTGTVLLYDGQFGAGSKHVYSWDGGNWTDLPFTGGPPTSAFQGGFSVDPVRQVVVLLADDVNQRTLQQWEFDGQAWTHRDVVTPPERGLVQTATDEQTHTIVLFGGLARNDTWTWDGTQWTQQHPVHAPSVRTSTGPMPGLTYDAATAQVVVFGGIDFLTDAPLNDTWPWDGQDWTSS